MGGHRHNEEDGGREKDALAPTSIAKNCCKHREVYAISTKAIAKNYREQVRRTAPQRPVPLPGD